MRRRSRSTPSSSSSEPESESSGQMLPISYPDPSLHYPRFKLSSLPDVPPHYRLLGETADDVVRTRKFLREQLEAMLEFYGWGIDMGIKARVTNLKILRSLWKLFYYYADYHKPASIRDLIDFGGKDSGPRLLSCELDLPSLLPVSRYYPNPPNLTDKTQPGYIRPANAAASIPDIYIEQMLKPSLRLSPSAAVAPVGALVSTRPQGAAGSNRKRASPPQSNNNNNNNNTNNTTNTNTDNNANNNNNHLVTTAVGPPPTAHTNPLTMTHSANPTGAFIPAPAPVTAIRVPAQKARAVIEAVEKTVMRFAYQELERDPTATPQDPQPFLTVLAAEDVSKALIGSFPANAQVRLAPDSMDADRSIIDPNGNDYPCRGRGPVWRDNSSAVDCLIVVGKLLDAGSTIIDRKWANWATLLTDVERAFIEATDINWDTITREESAMARDSLWRYLDGRIPGVQIKVLSPLWSIWSECAGQFNQFKFTYREAVAPCQCTGGVATVQTFTKTFVTPEVRPGDKNGVCMNDVIGRPFVPFLQADCAACSAQRSVTIERRFDTLPLRLVVGLHDNVSIKNHTKDISFSFCDSDGLQQTATYRWLGGIYYKDYHFRVFWTDTKRGEIENGFIQTYDSTMNEGLIVGDIPPSHKDERVPPAWWRNKLVPFLVYERVINPEPEVLSLAWHALSDLMKIQLDGSLILQQHTPWSRPEPTPSPPAPLWERCILDMSRFHTTAMGYSSLPNDVAGHSPVPAPRPDSATSDAQSLSSGTSPGSGSQPSVMQISPVPTGMKQASYMQAPTTYVAATAVGNPPPFISTFAAAQPIGVPPLEFNAANKSSLFNAFPNPTSRRSNSSQNSLTSFTNAVLMQSPGDGNAMQVSPGQQFFWIPSASNSPERRGNVPEPQGLRTSVSPDMMSGIAVRRSGGGGGRTSPWLQFVQLSPKRSVEEIQDDDGDDNGNNNANNANTNKNNTADSSVKTNATTSKGRKPRKRARAEPAAPTRRSKRIRRTGDGG